MRKTTPLVILLLTSSICTANTPLHDAARNGQFWDINFEIAKLQAEGTSIDSPDKQGQTALHVAAIKGITATVTKLLEAGANPNIKDAKGFTPFSYSLKYDKTGIMVGKFVNKKYNTDVTLGVLPILIDPDISVIEQNQINAKLVNYPNIKTLKPIIKTIKAMKPILLGSLPTLSAASISIILSYLLATVKIDIHSVSGLRY